MAHYFIIGGDGKEYGPVSEADIRLWIAEGRLNAQSSAKAESDTGYRALSLFPEFTAALQGQAAPRQAPATITPIKPATSFSDADYDLDIAACFSRGWELVKNNMGLLVGGTLIYMLIELAVGGLSSIPLIGPLFSLANFVASGPLMGGLFYLFIKVNRNEPADIGDIFSGFRRAFLQLFLGVLVVGLLAGLCFLPFVVVLIVKAIPMLPQLQQMQHMQPGAMPDATAIAAMKSLLVVCIPVFLVCLIPAMYLGICWKFTLPLIVDKQMDFSAAMGASWKMVNKHWWLIFGLELLIGLLNLAGMLACCVGWVISIPIGFAALMIAYETIFGTEKN